MKDLVGEPVLQRVVERSQVASTVDEVVVATTTAEDDEVIVDYCRDNDIEYFRGSENDVLKRYYDTAVEYDADTVVRVTSDCPLIGPETIDRIVGVYESGEYDFVTNSLYFTYPNGLDLETFSMEALECAHVEATADHKREHVDPYMRNPDRFNVCNVENPIDLSIYSFTSENKVLRWTVDYPDDLAFVREVYDQLWTNGEWLINQQAVLELLERKPELREINEDRSRNDYHLRTYETDELTQVR